MTVRGLVATLVVLGVAPRAGAQSVTVTQVSLEASTGYTDNASSAPSNSSIPRESDLFFTLTPELSFTRESPRLAAQLTLGTVVSRYLSETQANSVTASSSVALQYLVDPRLTWLGHALASYQDVAAFTPEGIIGAVPTGGARFLTLGADTGLSRDFSPRWRGNAVLNAQMHLALGDMPTTQDAQSFGLAVASQRTWKRDAGQLHLQLAVNHYTGRAMPDQLELVPSMDVSWLRELGTFWNSIVTVGVTVIEKDGELISVQPIGSAHLSWEKRQKSAYVDVAQTVLSNQLIGQTFATTSATAGVAVTLGKFYLLASGGAARGVPLGEPNEGAAGTSSVLGLNFGLSARLVVVENLSFVLQQQFLYQITKPDDGDDQRLVRNSIMLGVEAYFPRFHPRPDPLGMRLQVRESEERKQAEGQGEVIP